MHINRLALYSNSTLSTELGNNLDQALVSHMRTLSPDPCTLEVTIKGQYSIRKMARDIAEARMAAGRSYDILVCVYQISDRAYVNKTTRAVTVKRISDTASVDKWVEEIQMFCVVAKTAASRVLVVTSDAECFRAFEKEKSAYNSNVDFLREVLGENGVEHSFGEALQNLRTYDGYHFHSDVSANLLDAVYKWFEHASKTKKDPDE